MKIGEKNLKENLQFVPSQLLLTLVFLIFLWYLWNVAVQCPSVCLCITNLVVSVVGLQNWIYTSVYSLVRKFARLVPVGWALSGRAEASLLITDCPGLDGCQHQARGHPRVQGGAQYRAAEERGDKSSRGDPATSGLCLFSLGLHLFYEQHSRQDVKLQPNVTKSQEHRLHLKFDHLHHLDID